jgi:hypothetical protein
LRGVDWDKFALETCSGMLCAVWAGMSLLLRGCLRGLLAVGRCCFVRVCCWRRVRSGCLFGRWLPDGFWFARWTLDACLLPAGSLARWFARLSSLAA